jgi:outer membrane protein OmpA-like peptidoglycan-associated protein
VALREDTVGFEDNSAELRDESSARSTLKQLATDIKTGNHRILLVGTTATAGTAAGRLELSLSRAEAVKRLLVQLGVPAKHIATKGVGTRHPEHVDDLDAKGNLVPALAVRNRAVFVTVQP